MKQARVILVCTILSSAMFSAAQMCTQLSQNATVKGMLIFLRDAKDSPPDQQNAACITLALRDLEDSPPTADDIAIILPFLGFRRPLTEPEEHGIQSSPPNIASDYPAVSTLMTFGKRAVPGLIATIETSDSSLIRRNAAFTLVGIFREKPDDAIRLLNYEASIAQREAADRLRAAAEAAPQWCGPTFKNECDAAANIRQPRSQ